MREYTHMMTFATVLLSPSETTNHTHKQCPAAYIMCTHIYDNSRQCFSARPNRL